jgi:spore cortex formation protein SpoVR/YcgB (stage V sporulation)
MLEKEIISHVEGKLEFFNTELYRMYMDREDIADNLLRRWKDVVRNALEVSINLVNLIEQVYK